MWCKYLLNEREHHICRVRLDECVCTNASESEVNTCAAISPLIGFLAPDGTFYWCEYWGHLQLAMGIVKKVLGREDVRHGIEAEDILRNEGYVAFHVRTVGFLEFLNGEERTLTDAQRDFMKRSLEFCPIDEKRKCIENILKEDSIIRKSPDYSHGVLADLTDDEVNKELI